MCRAGSGGIVAGVCGDVEYGKRGFLWSNP